MLTVRYAMGESEREAKLRAIQGRKDTAYYWFNVGSINRKQLKREIKALKKRLDDVLCRRPGFSLPLKDEYLLAQKQGLIKGWVA